MANRIESMTPNQAWEAYVGSRSPREFCFGVYEHADPYDECSDYAYNSPMCSGLNDDERDELAEKLFAHTQANGCVVRPEGSFNAG